MIKIALIIGSTRPNRFADAPASGSWTAQNRALTSQPKPLTCAITR
jgi:hypothetical protein